MTPRRTAVRDARLACLRLAILLAAALPAEAADTTWETAKPVHGFRVVASYPHDEGAFTQGLAIAEGQLYEGTGNYGESALRRVEVTTGRILQETRLRDALFGEGIAIWGDTITQLTWRERTALVYDRASLRQRAALPFAGEGWGLTHDGAHWITSDGTDVLRFLEPETLSLHRRVEVRDDGRPLRFLNELEYVEGLIWANIWHNDMIAQIDPVTGEVSSYVDLSRLYPKAQRRRQEVLNGIAYDPATGRLLVTGKNWPQLYAIEILEAGQRGPGSSALDIRK